MDWRAVRRSSAWTRPCDRKKRQRSCQLRTGSVQSVSAILVSLAFSGSCIAALAALAWQVQHAATSWSLIVLLRLTLLMCLLSICDSETDSLHGDLAFSSQEWQPVLLCCSLPGTDFIAQMLPLLNSVFGSSSQSCYVFLAWQWTKTDRKKGMSAWMINNDNNGDMLCVIVSHDGTCSVVEYDNSYNIY